MTATTAAVLGILGRRMGVLQATAFVSIVGGVLLVPLALALVVGSGAEGLVDGLRQPAWTWVVPGILGVVVFLTFTFAPPRIGTFGTFALLIGGQLLAGIVIDSAGRFGVDMVPLTAVLVTVGALLVLRK